MVVRRRVSRRPASTVIESGDGNIGGHPDPAPLDFLHRENRHRIVRGDDRVEIGPALIEEGFHRLRPARIKITVADDELFIDRHAEFAQRFPVSLKSFLAVDTGVRAIDERDPAVSMVIEQVGDEMAHCFVLLSIRMLAAAILERPILTIGIPLRFRNSCFCSASVIVFAISSVSRIIPSRLDLSIKSIVVFLF